MAAGETAVALGVAAWPTARGERPGVYLHIGFIVTNLSRPAERVVGFYNQRGTCEQWIKEGKNATKWTGYPAARSPPMLSGFSFMHRPTVPA